MEIIGNLQSSILILQGVGDWQTPLVEALLLEQALMESGHRDHTLYTYPGLSHFFYPTDGWQSAMGPIESYVLHDMYRWLVSSERTTDQIKADIINNSEKVSNLENRIETEIEAVNQTLTNSLTEIKLSL